MRPGKLSMTTPMINNHIHSINVSDFLSKHIKVNDQIIMEKSDENTKKFWEPLFIISWLYDIWLRNALTAKWLTVCRLCEQVSFTNPVCFS